MRSNLLALAVAATALSSLAFAQCPMPTGGTITITQDSISGPMTIGFAFPFAGQTYTDCHISDHGMVFLSNAGTPAPPTPAAPLVYTPAASSLVLNSPVICPIWGDSIPGAIGQFFIDPQATTCTISWVDVVSFGLTGTEMTFQCILHDTGNIEFIYGATVSNNSTFGGVSDNGIVGVSEGGGATLPSSIDFSGSPTSTTNTTFEEFLAPDTFDMAGDSILMIPTNPGWVVIHTPGGAGCAGHSSYGVGCDGLMLTSNDPVLGTNWNLTTSGFDPISVVGATAFNFVPQIPALPLSALGFNAPGCDVNIGLGGAIVITGSPVAGTMVVTVGVPPGASFAGLTFYCQSVGLTPNNAANLATSNGEMCTLGN